MMDAWERRVRRAAALEVQWPFAAEILGFFRGLAELRRDLVRMKPGEAQTALADWVRTNGPSGLADAAFSEPPFCVFLPGRADRPEPPGEGRCPACNRPPLVSILREDKSAETVRRTLLCSGCLGEWDFPRVVCPECREERPEKLPRFTAEEIPWIRVEACELCRKYLKSVDLSKHPEADPLVDDLGSTPLDIIARERGYSKISPNLAGC